MKKVTKFGIIRVEMEGFKKFKEPYSVKLDKLTYIYIYPAETDRVKLPLPTQSLLRSVVLPFGVRKAAIDCKMRNAIKCVLLLILSIRTARCIT